MHIDTILLETLKFLISLLIEKHQKLKKMFRDTCEVLLNNQLQSGVKFSTEIFNS